MVDTITIQVRKIWVVVGQTSRPHKTHSWGICFWWARVLSPPQATATQWPVMFLVWAWSFWTRSLLTTSLICHAGIVPTASQPLGKLQFAPMGLESMCPSRRLTRVGICVPAAIPQLKAPESLAVHCNLVMLAFNAGIKGDILGPPRSPRGQQFENMLTSNKAKITPMTQKEETY